MPLMTEALLNIKTALALRDFVHALLHRDVPGVELGFICPECKAPVKPTQEGTDRNDVRYGAHFEHLDRNSKCPLSDKR